MPPIIQQQQQQQRSFLRSSGEQYMVHSACSMFWRLIAPRGAAAAVMASRGIVSTTTSTTKSIRGSAGAAGHAGKTDSSFRRAATAADVANA